MFVLEEINYCHHPTEHFETSKRTYISYWFHCTKQLIISIVYLLENPAINNKNAEKFFQRAFLIRYYFPNVFLIEDQRFAFIWFPGVSCKSGATLEHIIGKCKWVFSITLHKIRRFLNCISICIVFLINIVLCAERRVQRVVLKAWNRTQFFYWRLEKLLLL